MTLSLTFFIFQTHPCLFHFALAVSGQGLGIHLTPLDGTHQVSYGLLTLSTGRPVNCAQRLLQIRHMLKSKVGRNYIIYLCSYVT